MHLKHNPVNLAYIYMSIMKSDEIMKNEYRREPSIVPLIFELKQNEN